MSKYHRYTDEEIDFCVGYECIFNNSNELALNTDKAWNDNEGKNLVNAIIKDKPIKEDPGRVYVKMQKEQQFGYSSIRVTAIPLYDKLKRTRLFRLVK